MSAYVALEKSISKCRDMKVVEDGHKRRGLHNKPLSNESSASHAS